MIIETERLRLRPLTMDDVAWVKELLSDPKVAAALPAVPYPVTDADVEVWVRGALQDVTFAIERPADGAVGGVIGIHLEDGNRGQVGGWCGEPYRRNGYAAEALHAIVRYGYEELGLETVYTFRKGRLWVAPPDFAERRLPFRRERRAGDGRAEADDEQRPVPASRRLLVRLRRSYARRR